MLPFEFVVAGTPLSHQTRNRRRLAEWKTTVRESAAAYWPTSEEPANGGLRLVVSYFHERPSVRIDGDNLVKPIQDALIGLVYVDDAQIVDVTVRKRSIDGTFRIRGMSRVLADGFINGEEFIYVRIERVEGRADIP